MDLNDRIAARRAQLVREEEEGKAAARVMVEREKQAERVERQEALDAIAAEVSQPDAAVVREGDDLAMVTPPRTLDVDGLSERAITKLLSREARRRFTPGENWQVIGCIVGGITTLHLAGIGFLLLVAGFWRRAVLLERKAAELRHDYPDLFGADDGEPKATITQRLWWNPHAER